MQFILFYNSFKQLYHHDINLKTWGVGIVKSVGLDQSATELLTGAQIDAFKASLEMQILFNKDIIPKALPCAIVILDTEIG